VAGGEKVSEVAGEGLGPLEKGICIDPDRRRRGFRIRALGKRQHFCPGGGKRNHMANVGGVLRHICRGGHPYISGGGGKRDSMCGEEGRWCVGRKGERLLKGDLQCVLL